MRPAIMSRAPRFCFMSLLLVGLGQQALMADPVRPETGPWIPDVLMWRLEAQGWTGRYRWNSCAPSQALSLLAVSAAMAPSDTLDVQARFSLMKGPHQKWNWDVFQLYARDLFWDEYQGDLFSAALGGVLTFGSNRSVHQPAEFVPSNVNGEVQLSAGREWSRCANWWLRTDLLGGVGLANQGGPWFRGYAQIAAQLAGRHSLGFALEAIRTTGSHDVFKRHFGGSYALRKAHWLDGWLEYRYEHPIWGALALQWQHRFVAVAAPQQLNLGNVCLTYSTSL